MPGGFLFVRSMAGRAHPAEYRRTLGVRP